MTFLTGLLSVGVIDNGIQDFSLIARIADVTVAFVKKVLSQAGRISPVP